MKKKVLSLILSFFFCIFFYFGYKVVMEIARRMAITIKTTNSDKATLYAALFDEIEGLQ